MINLEALFDEHHEDEFLDTESLDIVTLCYDLYAISLLQELAPATSCILSGVRGERLYFSTDVVDLSKVITESQVITLIRCGVMYDKGNGMLCMFV
jgi:hypothetical protein